MLKSRAVFLLVGASVLAVASSAFAQGAGPAAGATAAPTSAAEVENIVVTGSRLATGFRAPTPVTVVGTAQIEQRAPTSIIDALTEIPQFRSMSSPTNNMFGVRNVGQSNLDLRTLGIPRTLVLFDGRRHVPGKADGSIDVNQIPTSLIDRVEVVTGGASSAYGSDAVAGVVNFVLKKRMEGVTANVTYGVSQRGDNKELQVNLALGTSFAGGRGHFIAGGDYADVDGVGYMLDVRDWGRREPGIVSLAANRTPGLPANIISNYVEASNSCFGGYIANTALAGTCFDASGSPFILPKGEIVGATTMISTRQVNRGNRQFATQSLKGAYKRSASLARVEYEVTPDVTVFGSFNYATVRAEASGTPTSPTVVILRDNPYLPASIRQAMVAGNIQSFNLNVLGGQGNAIHEAIGYNPVDTWETVVGASGKVFEDWNWDFGYVHGNTHSVRTLDGYWKVGNWYSAFYAVPGPNGTPICGPVATNPNFPALDPIVRTYVEPGCVPWNPFGGQSTNQGAVDYSEGRSLADERIIQDHVSLNFSGDLFSLPAGPLSLATGVEWRKNQFTAVAGHDSRPFYLVNENNVSYTGEVVVKEAYGEVGAPLLKDVAFAKSLDLNGAFRVTDYSTSGTVTTWKVGGTWDVNDSLRIRATRSRDIRAPNISELFAKGTQGRFQGTNPLTGASGLTYNSSSGNPNLKQETANTWTVGVVVQPTWSWASGFRGSLDYYQIKIADVIGSIASQDAVNYCLLQNRQEYCDRITLSSTSPTGIGNVAARQGNLNRMLASGVDMELAYRVPLSQWDVPGTLDFRVLGSWVDHLTTVAGGVAQDTVSAGVPEWTWTGNLDYRLQGFNIGLQARFRSEYRYSLALVGPDSPNYNPAAANSINKNYWPGIVYYSLNSGYEWELSDRRRVQVYGIVDNLLDKDPPLVASILSITGPIPPYDLIGRTFKVGLRVSF